MYQTPMTPQPRYDYLGRSWVLLTHDKGWFKPILVMAAAMLVPVAGPLGVLGYQVEWARLVAWGADAHPKQKDVRLGACIASGWRSFLVLFGWQAVMACAVALLALVPLVGGVLAVAGQIAAAVVGAALPVAVLRASVYQRASAGYKLDNLCEMAERDPKGLMFVILIGVVGQLIVGVVIAIPVLVGVTVYLALGLLPAVSGIEEPVAGLAYLLDMFAALAPLLVVACVAYLVASCVLNMLVYGAAGLFVSQFGVAAWGRSADPLPAPAPQVPDPGSWRPPYGASVDPRGPSAHPGFTAGALPPAGGEQTGRNRPQTGA